MVDHQKVTERRISCIKFPCTRCNFCYVEETSQWFDEREKQHKCRVKNCDSNNGIYKHLEKIRIVSLYGIRLQFWIMNASIMPVGWKNQYTLICLQRMELWI
jgi:hypothetical protein